MKLEAFENALMGKGYIELSDEDRKGNRLNQFDHVWKKGEYNAIAIKETGQARGTYSNKIFSFLLTTTLTISALCLRRPVRCSICNRAYSPGGSLCICLLAFL